MQVQRTLGEPELFLFRRAITEQGNENLRERRGKSKM